MNNKIKNIEQLDNWFNNLSKRNKVVAYACLADDDIDKLLVLDFEDLLYCYCGEDTVENVIECWNRSQGIDKLEMYLIFNKIRYDYDKLSEHLDYDNASDFANMISRHELET
ncbi:MAG: hypothetical protein IKT40_12175 [Bacilli bacterium]|nr:hypothetical protein [Bacilli bacterium]